MDEVIIGKGNMFGKGVFATRDFKKGDVVIQYRLKHLTMKAFQALSEHEKNFVHSHFGKRYLYSSPERYVNHSSHPSTVQNLKEQCDIASRDIRKGEEITTNAAKDDSL